VLRHGPFSVIRVHSPETCIRFLFQRLVRRVSGADPQFASATREGREPWGIPEAKSRGISAEMWQGLGELQGMRPESDQKQGSERASGPGSGREPATGTPTAARHPLARWFLSKSEITVSEISVTKRSGGSTERMVRAVDRLSFGLSNTNQLNQLIITLHRVATCPRSMLNLPWKTGAKIDFLLGLIT